MPLAEGVYAVDITTQQGDCHRAHHWLITVAGGHVTSAGVEASGQINRRGIVDLAFRRMDKVARVTGRLADGSGSHLVVTVPVGNQIRTY
jgi:hypothetical protein